MQHRKHVSQLFARHKRAHTALMALALDRASVYRNHALERGRQTIPHLTRGAGPIGVLPTRLLPAIEWPIRR
jgi:hypothetical protein